MRHVERAALALAGGFLTNAAFPGQGWWPLAVVGVACLLSALRGLRLRPAAGIGALWGLAFFLPHVRWAVDATGSLLPWVALSVMQASYIAGFGALWAWTAGSHAFRDHPVRAAVAASFLWVAVEQVRASWPFGGLPWGGLAFSQTNGPLLRLAPYGGEILVSATVAFSGALLATAWQAAGRGQRLPAAVAAVAVIALLVTPALLPVYAGEEAGSLRVGAVQGNVPERGADWEVQARDVTGNHADGTTRLLASATEQLDVVLWPESAADIDPRTDTAQAALVDAAARAAGAPVVLGTQRFPPGEDVRYNEMVVWQAGLGAGATYAKQHPVPFGEYVPYRDLFRQITPLVDQIGTDMAAGTEPSLLPVPIARLDRDVPVVVGICFEVAYRDLVREGVLAGGELILIPTNNASFGLTAESTQQLAMSRFRAAEHGRATVQISTVGVSAIVMPDGTVAERTGLFTAEELTGVLPLRTSLTPAARLGKTPDLVVLVVTLLVVAAAARGLGLRATVTTGAGRGHRAFRTGRSMGSVRHRRHLAAQSIQGQVHQPPPGCARRR
ncbi:apolipoprotein N-acyltransferase [Aquipuribacter hungaricus]|uniref:Apolipoprotein N-acyltransferase n=1 Tax=Aquipuribacter hungaricus TaxID=545624 RepID=A0ABV7WJY7_9MICO